MNLRIRMLLIASLMSLTASATGQTRHIRIEAEPQNKAQFMELVYSDLDLHAHGDHIELLVSKSELANLQEQGIGINIISPNVYDPVEGNTWLPEYLSFFEVETQLNGLAANFPDLTELTVIGTSLEGRNIYALKISDNAATDEEEAEILLIGNHHAREVITPIICMHVAEELLNGYGSDPTYTDWIDNREIWIVPVLNPDGYVYVENVDLFWRKNRRDNPGDNEGVDLNRNWGFQWGHDDNGSSSNFGSSTYRGAAPFSEPETNALQQFVTGREFTVAMSFHSYGNLLLWGPGYKPSDGPDQDIFSGFGDVIGAQNNYTLGNPAAGTIYLTNGDATDWLYHVEGIIAFTPEVGRGQDYFNPPANRIPVLVEQGSVCAWEAIRYGDRPGQLAPPGQPKLNDIGFSFGDYTITWDAPTEADTEVIAYELVEKTGSVVITDGAENGDGNYNLNGWTVSSERSNDGGFSYFGGAENYSNYVCLSKEGYVVQPGDAYTFDAWFDLENEWDYAYAIISTDGGRSYQPLEGTFTTMDDPNGRNADHGITGNSGGWQSMSFDLSEFVGQTVWLGFRYSTDRAVLGDGIWIDNVQPVQTWTTSTIVDSNITGSQYSMANRTDGGYVYTLRGLDGEGNWGYPSAYTTATVSDQFTVLPSDFMVTRGQYASGTLEDTQASDDQDLSIFRSSADIQSRTELEVTSTSPSENPGSITVILEGAVFARSPVNQTLEVYDFSSGQWESLDTRVATRFSDSLVSIPITGDLTRLVEPGSRTIKARVRYQSINPRQVFSSATDQLAWLIEAN